MRIIAGLVLATVTATGALAADLRSRAYDEPDGVVYRREVVTYAPRHVVRRHIVRRHVCGDCWGPRLPFGGLRGRYAAQLPYGGLWKYCPPVIQTREIVLRRKG